MRIEDLETPAIVVDLDILERNIARLSSYAAQHGLSLRPHIKTHKIPTIAQMQLASGCAGVTVAKAGEAEVMAEAGIADILVHYPIYGAGKSARLAQLARTCRLGVAIDSLATARSLSEAAAATRAEFQVLAEFDSGMRRCGVDTPDQMAALAKGISELPYLKFTGITTYPGHIWAKPSEQAPALEALSHRIGEMLHALASSGLECATVSAGSTPTAYNTHLVRGLTEMRPGTYVFNDRNTLGAGACSVDQCALRVMVTVVSTAVRGRAIVDGGSKTFASDRWIPGDGTGFGLVVEAPDLQFHSMSEEHGHLDIPPGRTTPRIGEKLSVIPNHVCACVNMHERIHYHRNGIVEGVWDVAGRGKVR